MHVHTCILFIDWVLNVSYHRLKALAPITARCVACHYHTKIYTILTPSSYFPYRDLPYVFDVEYCTTSWHKVGMRYGKYMFTAPSKYQMVRHTAGAQSTGRRCLFTVLPKATNFRFQCKDHNRGEIKICSNNFSWNSFVLKMFGASIAGVGLHTNNLRSCDLPKKPAHAQAVEPILGTLCTAAAHFFGTQAVQYFFSLLHDTAIGYSTRYATSLQLL